ncbi:endonuclease domain-containing protein [Mycobacteroides chelonae]|uniref:endonuclease domain-containing protein n=1 Tax=Mycobacteroides TaxID=670516 RepID=UPI0008A8F2C5|nr:DUF559 domain-containing protein [Mycobacteroides chelonae]AYM40686.1 DUF559 domain-containing protein [[Mycobacterium] chelonae subsp. gwanakae]OHU16260.1 hypothetical protein BKG75_14785 [Mycobacteroides chelonae]
MGKVPWPFRSGEAIASGTVTEHEIRRRYEQLYPSVYVPRGSNVTAIQRARAAWLWSRRGGVVAGLSASALLGSKWVGGSAPAELIYQNHKAPKGLRVHRESLLADEVASVDGLAATSAARTAFDLGRWLPLDAAVERLDALIAATGVSPAQILQIADMHPGARGLVALGRALELVDGGAESPQETRTRLLLVRAGFPTPRTQIRVYTRYGEFVARIDMGWEDLKLGVEFDGAQHWTDPHQRSRDVDRSAGLSAEGWTIIRVTSEMLRHRAGTIVARVDEAFRTAMSSGNLARDFGRFAS